MEKDFQVEKVGSCVVITMDLGENRLNNNFIRAMSKALDEAEGYEDAKCLVTTGVGKHYSLGLDLEWMGEQPFPVVMEFSNDLQKLMARLLTFPMVTVAAMNGHVYAGGAFMAICHDHMMMRSGKGWFCFPEVKINRNFTVGYIKLAKARLPLAEQHHAIVLGKRYTAEEALAAKIIHEVCPAEELKVKAIASAHQLAGKEGLNRTTLSTIKYDMYRDTYRTLLEPIRFYSKM